MIMNENSAVLDVTGLACPMPVIKLKKWLSQNRTQMEQSGEVLRLQLSDKGGIKDIPAFCQQQSLSCQLVSEGDVIEFAISAQE